jgi:hypothetical protein
MSPKIYLPTTQHNRLCIWSPSSASRVTIEHYRCWLSTDVLYFISDVPTEAANSILRDSTICASITSNPLNKNCSNITSRIQLIKSLDEEEFCKRLHFFSVKLRLKTNHFPYIGFNVIVQSVILGLFCKFLPYEEVMLNRMQCESVPS